MNLFYITIFLLYSFSCSALSKKEKIKLIQNLLNNAKNTEQKGLLLKQTIKNVADSFEHYAHQLRNNNQNNGV